MKTHSNDFRQLTLDIDTEDLRRNDQNSGRYIVMDDTHIIKHSKGMIELLCIISRRKHLCSHSTSTIVSDIVALNVAHTRTQDSF